MNAKFVRCPDCDGTGWIEGEEDFVPCERCDGQGKIGADEVTPPHKE